MSRVNRSNRRSCSTVILSSGMTASLFINDTTRSYSDSLVITAGKVSASNRPYFAGSGLVGFDGLSPQSFLLILAVAVIFPPPLIILFVSQDMQDVDLLAAIVDVCDEPIFIAANIEGHAFTKRVRRREVNSHVSQAPPRVFFSDLRPGSQWRFRVRI